jgi:hypothetical protein
MVQFELGQVYEVPVNPWTSIESDRRAHLTPVHPRRVRLYKPQLTGW